MLVLRKIQEHESEDVYKMFQEIPAEENGVQNKAYGLSEQEFEAFCRKRMEASFGIGLPEGYVPDTCFILFSDSVPVGFSKLRHFLNEALLKRGGHIGYSIRPSYRRRGLGKEILAETLKEAVKLQIKKALITINENNIASRKVCEHNGGKLEKIIDGECSYWIDL